MTNPVQAMLDANKTSLVIEGRAPLSGGGWYKLEDGSIFSWSKKDMKEFQAGGGDFSPCWKLPKAVCGHIAFRDGQVVAMYIEDDIEEEGEPGRTFADWQARGLDRKTYEDMEEFNAVIAAAQ